LPEEIYPGQGNSGEDMYKTVSGAKKKAVKMTITTRNTPLKQKTDQMVNIYNNKGIKNKSPLKSLN